MVDVFDVVEQTLSGLAGPGCGGESVLRLARSQKVVELLGGDGLVTEPEEVLLLESEQRPKVKERRLLVRMPLFCAMSWMHVITVDVC